MHLKVASLFCGCGGFDLGFTGAEFTPILAVDSNPHAIRTYNANFKLQATLMDVASIRRDKNVWDLLCSADVIIGGPPCTDF